MAISVTSTMVNGGFGGLCENGHDVPTGARFCPACGSPAHAPSFGQDHGGAQDVPPVAPYGPPAQYPPGYFPYHPYPSQPPYGYGSAPVGPYPQPPYAVRPGYRPPYDAGGYVGYGPSYWSYGPPTRATNGLAIASMVLGILWLWWIGSILGVIFGHIALHQIRMSGEGGRGMAIAGLVIGYLGLLTGVLLVIIGLAAASGSGA